MGRITVLTTVFLVGVQGSPISAIEEAYANCPDEEDYNSCFNRFNRINPWPAIAVNAAVDSSVSDHFDIAFSTGDIFLHNPPDGTGGGIQADGTDGIEFRNRVDTDQQMMMLNSSLKATVRAAAPVAATLRVAREDLMPLRPSLDYFTSRLDKWLEEIDAASDKDEAVDLSFSEGAELADFIDFVIDSPPPDMADQETKNRFLKLFDQFVKSLLYFWFQLHFFDYDGKDDGVAHFRDKNWQDIESRVVRQNIRFDHDWWTDVKVTRVGVYNGKSVVDLANRQMVESSVPTNTLAEVSVSPAPTMVRVASNPAIQSSIMELIDWDGILGNAEPIKNRSAMPDTDRNEKLAAELDQNERVQSHNTLVKNVMFASIDELVQLRAIQKSCDSSDSTDFQCMLGPVGFGGVNPITDGISSSGPTVYNRTTPSGVSGKDASEDDSKHGDAGDEDQDEGGDEDDDGDSDEQDEKPGQWRQNLALWFDALQNKDDDTDLFDSKDVLVTFAKGSELDALIDLIKNPPPANVGEAQKKNFLELFDKVFKELMYFWFQLHFLHDGEPDTEPGVTDEADLGGQTWEQVEPLVIRLVA